MVRTGKKHTGLGEQALELPVQMSIVVMLPYFLRFQCFRCLETHLSDQQSILGLENSSIGHVTLYVVADVAVSKNRGTPKWMVYFMENPIKIDDLGVQLFWDTPMCVSFFHRQSNNCWIIVALLIRTFHWYRDRHTRRVKTHTGTRLMLVVLYQVPIVWL